MVNSESKSEEEKNEKEKRKEYFEELGVEPKRVEEHETGESKISVVEPDGGGEGKERRKEEKGA